MVGPDPHAQPGSRLYQRPSDIRYPECCATGAGVEQLVNITGGAEDELCVPVIATISNGALTYTRLDGTTIDTDVLTVTPVTDLADCCPSILVLDSFTDIDGTDLLVHAPDIDALGGGWSYVAWDNNPLGSVSIQSDKAEYDISTSTHLVASINAGKADVVISANIQGVAGANRRALIARHTLDGLNTEGWALIYAYNAGATNFEIMELTSGTQTERAGAVLGDLGQTTAHNYVMKCNGNAINATFDGANEIFYGSATRNQTETNHGMFKFERQCIMDDFKIEEIT
jgi:hypothetical protein